MACSGVNTSKLKFSHCTIVFELHCMRLQPVEATPWLVVHSHCSLTAFQPSDARWQPSFMRHCAQRPCFMKLVAWCVPHLCLSSSFALPTSDMHAWPRQSKMTSFLFTFLSPPLGSTTSM